MKPPAYTYRSGCGTGVGLIDHAAAGEIACPVCRRYELFLEVAHELIPSRPTPPGLLPLSAAQVAKNRRVLQRSCDEEHDSEPQRAPYDITAHSPRRSRSTELVLLRNDAAPDHHDRTEQSA